MRHRQSGRHFGRETSHRLSMYRNLVTDLLRYERITTTEAKAKEIRPLAEKMVTLAKRGDIHARRQAMKFIYDTRVVKHLWDDIGPRMADRPGGYLRITKLEPRKGDAASMAAIEFVDYWGAGAPTATPAGGTATRAAAPPRAAAAPAAAPAAAVADDEDAAADGAVAEDTGAEAIAEESVEAEAAETATEAEASVAEAEADDEEAAESEPGDESDDKS